MTEFYDQIQQWKATGQKVAIVTVLTTWGSSPRPAGSLMAVSSGGSHVGSVSGGCVEGAVITEALEVLQTGIPKKLHYGVADDTAWSVGLACGGMLDIWVEPLDDQTERLLASGMELTHPVIILTIIENRPAYSMKKVVIEAARGQIPPDVWDQFGNSALASWLSEKVNQAVQTKQPVESSYTYPDKSENTLVAIPFFPPPQVVAVGGGHITVSLVKMAGIVGYRTIVIDPRKAFANHERFPTADLVIPAWPQHAFEKITITSSTAIAILTHDPKIDDPAIILSLASQAFYIGALGSKRTHALRKERLSEAGVPAEAVARIRAPIGLPLGGRSAEEIALSILAEITSIRYNQVQEK